MQAPLGLLLFMGAGVIFTCVESAALVALEESVVKNVIVVCGKRRLISAPSWRC
jgi:hypothetical protein